MYYTHFVVMNTDAEAPQAVRHTRLEAEAYVQAMAELKGLKPEDTPFEIVEVKEE